MLNDASRPHLEHLSHVVTTHSVPNLVVLPLSQDFTFTIASPYIVLYMRQYVKLIFKITLLHVLLLSCRNCGTLMTKIPVLLVLPI
jgi:hypothetical protein